MYDLVVISYTVTTLGLQQNLAFDQVTREKDLGLGVRGEGIRDIVRTFGEILVTPPA